MHVCRATITYAPNLIRALVRPNIRVGSYLYYSVADPSSDRIVKVGPPVAFYCCVESGCRGITDHDEATPTPIFHDGENAEFGGAGGGDRETCWRILIMMEGGSGIT
jgi:hypothetical protein